MIKTNVLKEKEVKFSFTHESQEKADLWIEEFKTREQWEKDFTTETEDLTQVFAEAEAKRELEKKNKEDIKKADVDKMDLNQLKDLVKKIVNVLG